MRPIYICFSTMVFKIIPGSLSGTLIATREK